MAPIMFFAIGVVEMFIVALWTKFVSGSQVIASGIVTFVNTVLYLYVLEALLSNVHDAPVIILYAVGSAIGTMLAANPKFKEYLEAVWTYVRENTRREQFSSITNEPESVV